MSELIQFKEFILDKSGSIIENNNKCLCKVLDGHGNEKIMEIEKDVLIGAEIINGGAVHAVDNAQPSTSKLYEEFNWNRSTTLLLIEKYKHMKEDFRDPKIKKRGLWNKITQEFKNRGYSVTEEGLDRKFRNLKKTYSNIKDNIKKTGRGRIAWEHYDTFEEIFKEDKTINIPKTVSSMPVEPVVGLPSVIQENAGPLPSTSTQLQESEMASPLHTPTSKTPAANKMSALYKQRKKQLEIEEKRVEEIRLLRIALEENTKVQRERNEILNKMLNKSNK